MIYVLFWPLKDQVDTLPSTVCFCARSIHFVSDMSYYFQLQLWDTAGQERFRKCMVQHYYRNVHAVVVVYDVTKMTSFEVSIISCIML